MDEVLTIINRLPEYAEAITTDSRFISSALTTVVVALGFAFHVYVTRRGKRKAMAQRIQRKLNKRLIADYFEDTLLTMAARGVLNVQEYYEVHSLIAHALKIADMMPKQSQKALKQQLKRARANRQRNPEKPVNIPGPMPLQVIKKEEPAKVVNAMDKFKKTPKAA